MNYTGEGLIGPSELDSFFLLLLVSHTGQLAVIHGPFVFVLKHELNMSITVLESGTFIFYSLLCL